MKCPRCQHDNRPQAKFCEECAAPLARTCPNCGAPLSPTAKFSSECAHPATEAASPPRFGAPEAYTPKHLAEKILTSKSDLDLLRMYFRIEGRDDARLIREKVTGRLQAIDLARQQRTKSWELRAALSLSRLWQRQGKREAAAALLGGVLGWFTDGFDTADLREAGLFLDGLCAPPGDKAGVQGVTP